MIKGMHHIGISAKDVKGLSEFYREALGFEPVLELAWQAGTELGAHVDGIIGLRNSASKVVMLSRGGLIIELFEYSAPTPSPRGPEWQVCDHGITHICLEVEDLGAECERLRTFGMTFHAPPPAEPYNGMKAIYGRDPEGNVIELLEIFPAG